MKLWCVRVAFEIQKFKKGVHFFYKFSPSIKKSMFDYQGQVRKPLIILFNNCLFSLFFSFSKTRSVLRTFSFLFVLTSQLNAIQFRNFDIYNSGTEECALIIVGPGRTSLYDYTYNLLRAKL